jgi:Heterokaryon incompatibility protein (HET)
MGFLHKHIKDCNEEYVCKEARETWPPNTPALLPSRVLEVENTAYGLKARLVMASDGQRSDYVALSHCWGRSKNMLTTTTQNLEQRLAAIDWDSLPKTFQDALTITAELKIKYTWIDSLCILQDDQKDWEIESAKMGNIYAKSYLTIAATGSIDCDGGLLNTRQRLFDEKTKLVVPHRIKEVLHPFTNAKTKIFVRHALSSGPLQLHNAGYSATKTMLAPLLTRAWGFQERLLSPRVVHFHGEEMVFECKTMTRCECTALDFEHNRTVRINSLGPQSFKYRFNQTVSHGGDTGHIAHFWLDVVAIYMDLKLTKEIDRLPAIAALAKMVGRFFDSYYDPMRSAYRKGTTRYVAGLWRHTLPESLLWRRSASVERCWRSDIDVPTWSWAAIRYDNNQDVRGISWERSNSTHVDSRCKVIEVLGPPPDISEYFSFPDGRISLRAAIKSAMLIPVSSWDRRGSFNQTAHEIRAGYALSFNGEMDSDDDVALDLTLDETNAKIIFAYKRVYCVLIASISDYSYAGHKLSEPYSDMVDIALVVRKSSEGGYERIGLSKHSKERGRFEDAPVQVIHVV